MTTYGRVGLAGMAVVAVMAGCGQPQPGQAAEDLLFLRGPRGVAVVEAGAAVPNFRGAAVPTRDWSTVVSSTPNGGSTSLVAVSPSTGTEHWQRSVPGNLKVKVVSEKGDLVAMGPVNERYYAWGRAQTKLVIAGSGLEEPRRITLEGNYEPEAFSTDGNSLFVIRYLPARAPTKYQVRRLDLITEEVVGVYTPDAHLQKAMGGTARIQTASPDGRRLYTLYTVDRRNDRDYAFIHVLSLDGLWAHCIDLPPEFATEAETNTAITTSPDGNRLYVANSLEGMVAEIDTNALRVTRTADVGLGVGNTIHAIHGTDGVLYVTSDFHLTAIDTADLSEVGYWTMPETITGIQVRSDARKLYVGLKKSIVILDTETGSRLETIDPPGVNKIDQFGPVLDAPEEPTSFTCAC